MNAEQYRHAIDLNPSDRQAWYNLGCVHNSEDREAEAVPCFRRAIEIEPAHAPSHHNLGQALFNLGDTDGAIERYREAIALGGGALSETMLAMTIGVSPSADPQTILQTRRRWAEQHLPEPMWSRRSVVEDWRAGGRKPPEVGDRTPDVGVQPLGCGRQVKAWTPTAGRKSGGERLRVGYVSAFFDHPNWMKPVWALVNRHDREQFELFLYSDGRQKFSPDGYRPDSRDRWHWTGALSNVELARLIAAHELDLLVDLNGFSRLPRLSVFALRPAPLQVGWFNLFATTGTNAFDYLIGDETVFHPGEEADYCERIVRLSGCYLTFEVTYPVPDVAPAPCQASGRFTFGSLASLYKITPHVAQLWGRILRKCPESRLLLRNSGFRSTANRDWLREQFVRQGIDASRLHLEGPTDHFNFLRTYGEIDLALDTFPYNGGTTTSEAIWQGVPVVAIHGDRWTSRVSSSLLSNAGLQEFVTADAESYVNLAVATANDPAARIRLAELRLSMRKRLRQSSVCDVDGFARKMENAYVAMAQHRHDAPNP